MEQYRELIRYFLWIVEHHTGWRLDPGITELVVGASAAFILFLASAPQLQNFYFWVKRRFGAKDLPEDLQLLKDSAVGDLDSAIKKHLDAVVDDFKKSLYESAERHRDALARSSAGIKRKLSEYIRIANDNDGSLDDAELTGLGSQKRLKRAQALLLVKDTVLSKFLSGIFVEAPRDSHIFEFEGTFDGRVTLSLRLSTPYRARNREGSPYILEIWDENGKVLNFEWDEGGEAVVRTCLRRKEWEQLIFDWRLADKPSRVHSEPERTQPSRKSA